MLIGRDAECERLSTALEAAMDGAGGMWTIAGEPGIGKTTLLRWAAEQAGAALVAHTRGAESEADLPYAALADLLAPLAHHLDQLPAIQADVLSGAIGRGPPKGMDRFAVGVATLGLLRAAAEQQPIVLLVDDVQWVDSASIDALVFAGRRAEAEPVLVIASQRTATGSDEPRLTGTEVMSLEPLSPEAAAALLADGIAAPVAARLLDAARGNPLALVELPRLLSEGQLAGIEPLLDPIPTRNGLERAFASRLAPLSAAGRRAVLLAAADSSRKTGVVLEALAARGLDDAALREAEAIGLIELGANQVEFLHPLVRAAAYQCGDAAERRSAHAALADAEVDVDRAVWHRAAAILGADRDLAAQLAEAGERAVERGAPGAAAAAFERAAALAGDSAIRGRHLLAASCALDDLGNLPRALELARQAEALVDEPLAHARVVAQRASLQIALGDVEVASAAILEETERISVLDPTWAAGMMMLALSLPLHQLRSDEALRIAERAQSLGAEDRPRMLVEYSGCALSNIMAGHHLGTEAVLRLAREAPSAPLPQAHRQSSGVGWGLVWVEEYDEARTLLHWAADLQRTSGALRYLGQSLHVLAELDFRVGRWVSAYAHAYEAIQLYDETGQRAERGFAFATLARLEAACGRGEDCRAHAQTAFDSDAASGQLIASATASAAVGLLELGNGDPEAAVASLELAEKVAADGELAEPWIVHSAPDIVEAYVHTGRLARAQEVLDVFTAHAQATGRISALAAAHRCRGMFASSDPYREEFEEALSLHKLVPTPFERARTDLAYGERLRRDGKRSEARPRLQSALVSFERCLAVGRGFACVAPPFCS